MSASWLDRGATNWGSRRLKYAAPLRTTRADASSEDQEYVGLENIESWTGRYIPRAASSEPADGESEPKGTSNTFDVGDVLFGKLRPYLAKALLVDRPGVCTTELLVLRPGAEIEPRFLFYVLLSPPFVALVDSSTFGAKMPRANWDFIGTVPIPVPSLAVQRRIARYLDAETAQIDSLVSEKQALLTLLEEKRTVVATRALTRGPHSKRNIKPFGVEWLGAIPSIWPVRRCANLFTEIDERNEPELPLLNVSLNTGVTLRTFSEDRIESVAEDFASYKVARKNDLVANRMRFWQGAVGIAPVDGLTSPDYMVARIGRELLPAYVELLFRTPQFSSEVKRYSHGMVDDRLRLYWDEFKTIRIPVPPIADQKRIVAAVEREVKRITEVQETLTQSIALLKERRGLLITAAVTGQIEPATLAA